MGKYTAETLDRMTETHVSKKENIHRVFHHTSHVVMTIGNLELLKIQIKKFRSFNVTLLVQWLLRARQVPQGPENVFH